MTVNSVSVALTGSGGTGVMTAGQILLDSVAKAGWYGLMARSFGPQIRGGEAAALLRIADAPVQSADDAYDVFVALDWGNIQRFASEIPLHSGSLLITDPANGPVPDLVLGTEPQVVEIELSAIAKGIPGGRPNMVALGLVGELIGLRHDALEQRVTKALARKGDQVLAGALRSLEAGVTEAKGLKRPPMLAAMHTAPDGRWNISGNEATGLGALSGGVRFVAAYPITPATDVLEWLAPQLPKLDGALVQAEDELAAINMCLGASFGGTPALTATSGPGYSLMTEGLGLAVASETPVVVVDVMRGGPSTGIPTKSEQTDLNIAVYGLHGDAPHLVLAPTGIDDCLFTTQWAVYLAEALQTAAVVLSDQAMGQSRAIVDRPAPIPYRAARRTAPADAEGYHRYALTADGISPMAIPGTPGGEYTADGLEHNEYGTPSSQAAHHIAQLDKRRRKLDHFEYGAHWAAIEGDGPLAVVTWGSATPVVREALARARREGISARLVAPRLIAPARPVEMAAALEGCHRALVVEQNHDGQLTRYLRAHYDMPRDSYAYFHPGPLALRPAAVLGWLRKLSREPIQET